MVSACLDRKPLSKSKPSARRRLGISGDAVIQDGDMLPRTVISIQEFEAKKLVKRNTKLFKVPDEFASVFAENFSKVCTREWIGIDFFVVIQSEYMFLWFDLINILILISFPCLD
jgi:hypothetical protein